MQILQGKRIKKIYGDWDNSTSTTALRGIDISIEGMDFIGVMGPSGSGKTTLLNILGGIIKPTSGTVEIGGIDVTDMTKDELALFRRKRLGFVFQEYNLLDSLTIKENIMLPMVLDRIDPLKMESRAREVINLFDISDIANKYPYNTSGGQQQRAAVARALINQPDIIFADEPTGSLDSKSSRAIMECFSEANKKTGATILMVTHDAYAASYCRRVVFIKDGSINMEIIKKNTQREFYDRILDCLSVMGGERHDI